MSTALYQRIARLIASHPQFTGDHSDAIALAASIAKLVEAEPLHVVLTGEGVLDTSTVEVFTDDTRAAVRAAELRDERGLSDDEDASTDAFVERLVLTRGEDREGAHAITAVLPHTFAGDEPEPREKLWPTPEQLTPREEQLREALIAAIFRHCPDLTKQAQAMVEPPFAREDEAAVIDVALDAIGAQGETREQLQASAYRLLNTLDVTLLFEVGGVWFSLLNPDRLTPRAKQG